MMLFARKIKNQRPHAPCPRPAGAHNLKRYGERKTLCDYAVAREAMTRKRGSAAPTISIMVLGVGAFAQSTSQILKDAGANVSTYLTRNYGHYPPSLAGPTHNRDLFPSPCPLLKEQGVDLLVPMSIDWAQAPWRDELLELKVPILCPTGDGIKIER